MNSIGRNTANNSRDAIFRFCVTFTAAKLRISERNAKEKKIFLLLLFRTKVNSAKPKLRISERNTKQKTLFLIIFPNGSIFATFVAKLIFFIDYPYVFSLMF